MEIVNGYFFKYHCPRLAYRFCGVGRLKIINNELDIRSAVLLLFQINRAIVELDQLKIKAFILYAAEKGKAV